MRVRLSFFKQTIIRIGQPAKASAAVFSLLACNAEIEDRNARARRIELAVVVVGRSLDLGWCAIIIILQVSAHWRTLSLSIVFTMAYQSTYPTNEKAGRRREPRRTQLRTHRLAELAHTGVPVY